MSRPGSGRRAGARPGPEPGDLAADADRDKAAGMLQDAYAEGRLTGGEFRDRVSRVLEARTYAGIHAALGGLSASQREILPAPRPPGAPGGVRDAARHGGGRHRDHHVPAPRPGGSLLPAGRILARAGRAMAGYGILVAAGAQLSVPVRAAVSGSDRYGHGAPFPPGGPAPARIAQEAGQWAHFGITFAVIGLLLVVAGAVMNRTAGQAARLRRPGLADVVADQEGPPAAGAQPPVLGTVDLGAGLECPALDRGSADSDGQDSGSQVDPGTDPVAGCDCDRYLSSESGFCPGFLFEH